MWTSRILNVNLFFTWLHNKHRKCLLTRKKEILFLSHLFGIKNLLSRLNWIDYFYGSPLVIGIRNGLLFVSSRKKKVQADLIWTISARLLLLLLLLLNFSFSLFFFLHSLHDCQWQRFFPRSVWPKTMLNCKVKTRHRCPTRTTTPSSRGMITVNSPTKLSRRLGIRNGCITLDHKSTICRTIGRSLGRLLFCLECRRPFCHHPTSTELTPPYPILSYPIYPHTLINVQGRHLLLPFTHAWQSKAMQVDCLLVECLLGRARRSDPIRCPLVWSGRVGLTRGVAL